MLLSSSCAIETEKINIFVFRLFSGSQVFNRINLSQVSQAPEIWQPVQAACPGASPGFKGQPG